MGVRWYYGRGSEITGPMSGAELSGLAAAGDVLPTDTVWQEGVEDGVPASQVRNLFRPTPAAATTEVAPADGAATAVELSGVMGVVGDAPPAVDATIGPTVAHAETEPAAAPGFVGGWQSAPKTGRAMAGKGVVLVAQDGANVKYRGKCGTCGREDSSWKTIPIPRGSARVSFFCPKCRKRREGEIFGYR